MKLIVGLGNPGSQYERTRHNAGFMAVDRLAKDFHAAAFRTAHEGFACDISIAGQKVMLLKPITYMNLSGRSVLAAMQFYKLPMADVLVVVDDIALPCGTIRLRPGGSAGGHNGLLDIEKIMAAPALAATTGSGKPVLPVDYARLRIGIDSPGRVPQKTYVLEPFSPAQRPLLDEALDRATGAMAAWVEFGIKIAMNKFNASEPKISD